MIEETEFHLSFYIRKGLSGRKAFIQTLDGRYEEPEDN